MATWSDVVRLGALVRLPLIEDEPLRELLEDVWRCVAPPPLLDA